VLANVNKTWGGKQNGWSGKHCTVVEEKSHLATTTCPPNYTRSCCLPVATNTLLKITNS
jgi:hypothetical protein